MTVPPPPHHHAWPCTCKLSNLFDGDKLLEETYDIAKSKLRNIPVWTAPAAAAASGLTGSDDGGGASADGAGGAK